MRVAVIVAWKPKAVSQLDGQTSREAARGQGVLSYNKSVPPFSGILLASLLPQHWDIELIHESIRDVDLSMEVDAVFISTMDFSATHARWLCGQFKERKVKTIVGGLYPTLNAAYFLDSADAVVVGEAEPVIEMVVRDLERGQLKHIYSAGTAADLSTLPRPRYDLVESDFLIPMSYEATRGCPFRCSFCVLSALPVPHRFRPVSAVLDDIRTEPLSWGRVQRKYVAFVDNNLGANREYFRQLCEVLPSVRKNWGCAMSLDAVTPTSARLMGKSNCRVVYVGLESLSSDSLKMMNKRHNKISDYKKKIRLLHENGILVMSIFLIGMDGDTDAYLRALPDLIDEIGVDIPTFSLVAPIEGTTFRTSLELDGRLFPGDLNSFLDGSHLVYMPKEIKGAEVEPMLVSLIRETYRPFRLARRIMNVAGFGLRTFALSSFANIGHRRYELAIASEVQDRLDKRGPWVFRRD